MSARSLQALFSPASVAVLGASSDSAKWGHWLARGALAGESRRRVYLVNRRGGDVLGRRAYRSLTELPEAPELVVVVVPIAALEQAVQEALALGARAIVAISAGDSGSADLVRELATHQPTDSAASTRRRSSATTTGRATFPSGSRLSPSPRSARSRAAASAEGSSWRWQPTSGSPSRARCSACPRSRSGSSRAGAGRTAWCG